VKPFCQVKGTPRKANNERGEQKKKVSCGKKEKKVSDIKTIVQNCKDTKGEEREKNSIEKGRNKKGKVTEKRNTASGVLNFI